MVNSERGAGAGVAAHPHGGGGHSISKFGKKFPAIVIPTIHRRDFGTITLGFQ